VSLDCQILAWGTRAQQLFGFAPLEILGRYCYDTLPAPDAAGQWLCSVNCPMVVAARTGYSVGASEGADFAPTEVLGLGARQPSHPARAGGYGHRHLGRSSDITLYKQTEQLVRGIVSRINAEPVSARSAGSRRCGGSDDTATMLRTCFPDGASASGALARRRSRTRPLTTVGAASSHWPRLSESSLTPR
jgi:hypothetical protein